MTLLTSLAERIAVRIFQLVSVQNIEANRTKEAKSELLLAIGHTDVVDELLDGMDVKVVCVID